jgi:predicted alpha/beta-hydrolase family hydrolase
VSLLLILAAYETFYPAFYPATVKKLDLALSWQRHFTLAASEADLLPQTGVVSRMAHPAAHQLTIPLPDGSAVSGLLLVPSPVWAGYVLAHGAGAGMAHPFMTDIAEQLANRGIATLRYQFPYMERGSRRPDRARIAHVAVRAAANEAGRRLPRLPLFAGGKSFGGRMTSQAQAEAPLPAIKGLVFLGFPLHPAKQPSLERAHHLAEVRVPMLFLQGARDSLAEPQLIARVVAELGDRATLTISPDADHSFHVPIRSGRTNAQVMGEACDAIAAWMLAH